MKHVENSLPEKTLRHGGRDILDYASFENLYAEDIPWLNAWVGHVAFGHILVAEYRPSLLVELGTFMGVSFFSFCQAVREHSLATRCVAVDCWKGDAQIGFYGDDIYNRVKNYRDERYPDFAELKRMYFDEAAGDFEENSIDILHIDGLHTYEAVRHDFETWLPLVKSGGIILFHDVNEFQETFGAHRLWDEIALLSEEACLFRHSHGLGVWRKPGGAPLESSILASLLRKDSREALLIGRYTTLLADKDMYRKKSALLEKWVQDKDAEISSRQARIEGLVKDGEEQAQRLEETRVRLECAEETLLRSREALHRSEEAFRLSEEARLHVLNSRSMRITKPLRAVAGWVRNLGEPGPCSVVAKAVVMTLALPAVLADHGLGAFSLRKSLFRATLDDTDDVRFDRFGTPAFLWKKPLRAARLVRECGGLLPALRYGRKASGDGRPTSAEAPSETGKLF